MDVYRILSCIYGYLESRFDNNSSEEYLRYLSSLGSCVRNDAEAADRGFFESYIHIIGTFFKGDKCSAEDGLQYAKIYLKEYNRFAHEKLNSDIDDVERVFSECTIDDWARVYGDLPNSPKSSG